MSEQQKLNWVRFDKLKNLKDVELSFAEKRVIGIFGPNGCGKSTILHSLLCLYKPKNQGVNYRFSDFFKSDEYTNWIGSKITFNYSFRNREQEFTNTKSYTKRGSRWMKDYGDRPDRDVFFIGIDSCVPDIEKEKIKATVINTHRVNERINHDEDIMRAARYVMQMNYEDFFLSETASSKQYLTVDASGNVKYKSLSMGAGEQRVFRLLETIYNVPNYSLVIIDEIDLTLHTAALNRLIEKIVNIAETKKLQIIFTSHREELTLRQDIDIRHIYQTQQKTFCISNTTPACIDRITGDVARCIGFFVEDDTSDAIIKKILEQKQILSRAEITKFGAIENAFSVAAGLCISRKLDDNVIIVTDGDKYRTDDEKRSQIQKHLSGTEEDSDEKRQLAIEHIKQYVVNRDGMSPELVIWNALRNCDRESEIVTYAKDIVYTDDNHDYINEIIEKMGVSKERGLCRIIDEFAKCEETWNNYIREVSDWLDTRIYDLHLL